MTNDTIPTTSTGTMTTMTGNIVIGVDSIPTYDGVSNIDEFLMFIEETSTLASWTEKQIVSIARLKLRYQAKQFIDAEADLKNTTNWTTLKDRLKKQFTKQFVKGAAMKNFMECRQRTGESCRQFLTRLKLLGNRTIVLTGDPAKDDPIKEKLEQDITTQFTLGLLMPVKQRVLSGDPKSLDDAVKAAEREESIENLIHPAATRPCRNVESTNRNQFSSIQQFNGGGLSKIVKCSNCNKNGHLAKFCQNVSKIVCYKCNKPGHISTTCPENKLTEHRNQREKTC